MVYIDTGYIVVLFGEEVKVLEFEQSVGFET